MTEDKQQLETFLYHRVYRHELVVAVGEKLSNNCSRCSEFSWRIQTNCQMKFQDRIQSTGIRRAVADYLAGMTDQFFLRQHQLLTKS